MNMTGLAGFSNISSFISKFSRFRLPFKRVPQPAPLCYDPPPKRRPQESLEHFKARRKVFVQKAEIRMILKRHWDQSMRAIDVADAELDAVPKVRWIRSGEFTEAYGSGTVAQGKRRRDGFDDEAYNYGVDDSRPALVKRCCLPVNQQRDFLTDVGKVFSWDEADGVEREGKRIVADVMKYGWWMNGNGNTAVNAVLYGSIPQPVNPPSFPAHYFVSIGGSVLDGNKVPTESYFDDDDKTKCFRVQRIVSKEFLLRHRRYFRRRLDDQLKLRGYLNNRRSPLMVLERRRRRRETATMKAHVVIKHASETGSISSWDNLQGALLEVVDTAKMTVIGTGGVADDIAEPKDIVLLDGYDDYGVNLVSMTVVQDEDVDAMIKTVSETDTDNIVEPEDMFLSDGLDDYAVNLVSMTVVQDEHVDAAKETVSGTDTIADDIDKLEDRVVVDGSDDYDLDSASTTLVQDEDVDAVNETVSGTDTIADDTDKREDMVIADGSDDYELDSASTTLVQDEDVCSLSLPLVSMSASFEQIRGESPEVTAVFHNLGRDFGLTTGERSEAYVSAYDLSIGPSSCTDAGCAYTDGLQVDNSVIGPTDLASGLCCSDMMANVMDWDTNMGNLGTETSSNTVCLMQVVPNDVTMSVSDARRTSIFFRGVQGMVDRLSDVCHLDTVGVLSSRAASKSKRRGGKVEDLISDQTSQRSAPNQGHSVSSGGGRRKSRDQKRLEQLQEAITKESEEYLSTFDRELHKAQFVDKEVPRVSSRLVLDMEWSI